MSYYIITSPSDELGGYLTTFITEHPQARIIAMSQSFAGIKDNKPLIVLTILFSEA